MKKYPFAATGCEKIKVNDDLSSEMTVRVGPGRTAHPFKRRPNEAAGGALICCVQFTKCGNRSAFVWKLAVLMP